MRSRFLPIPILVLLAATTANAVPDSNETTFNVRPGHPMRLIAVNQSGAGDSTSTTWVIVDLDGALAAVDAQPALRAEASTIVRRPGRHHAVAHCGNHIATVVSCTMSASPAG